MDRIGFCVAALAMGLMSSPAMAADSSSCGDAPFPPALPSSDNIARLAPHDAETTRHQAFEDIVNWQRDLKTYRGCLTSVLDDDNRKITGLQSSGDKDDKDDITRYQGDVTKINARYNATVDTEKSIVGSYVALTKSYCSRQDVDQSVCQKAK